MSGHATQREKNPPCALRRAKRPRLTHEAVLMEGKQNLCFGSMSC